MNKLITNADCSVLEKNTNNGERTLRRSIPGVILRLVIIASVIISICLLCSCGKTEAAVSDSDVQNTVPSATDEPSPEDEITEGTVNNDIKWIFNKTKGILTISGEGDLDTDTWRINGEIATSAVKSLIIEEGITGIDIPLSPYYARLRRVTFPGSSIGNISEQTYSSMLSLEYVCIGAEPTSGIGWSYDYTTATLEIFSNGKGTGFIEGEKYWHFVPFADYTTFKHIIVHEGVKGIGFNVFWNHINVTTLELPASVYSIDNSNFADTHSLDKVIVHPDNKFFYTVNGCLYGYDTDKKGELVSTLLAVEETGHAVDISDYIPDTTDKQLKIYTHIDDNGKERMGFLADENGQFADDSWVYVYNETEAAEHKPYTYAVRYKGYTRKLYFIPRSTKGVVTVEPGTDVIGSFSFSSCTSVTEINLPLSVSEIGGAAFGYTKSLKRFDIAEGSKFHFDEKNCVLYSTEYSLDDGKLHSIMNIIIATPEISGHYVVPSSHEYIYINNGAFFDCKKLTEVTIPVNVQAIGDAAFGNCTSLHTVNMPESISALAAPRQSESTAEYLGYELFSGSAITSFKIPYSVSRIPEFCFVNCTELKEVIIPDTVDGIEGHAFSGCTALESIVLPNSVSSYTTATNFCEGLFEGCTALKNVALPANKDFTTLGYQFFAGCTSLENIVIPKNIKVIEEEAFLDCGLVTIDTNRVERIYARAFSGCKNLVSAEIPRAEEINDEAFLNCTSLEKVTVHFGNVKISDSAFSGCSALTEIPE